MGGMFLVPGFDHRYTRAYFLSRMNWTLIPSRTLGVDLRNPYRNGLKDATFDPNHYRTSVKYKQHKTNLVVSLQRTLPG